MKPSERAHLAAKTFVKVLDERNRQVTLWGEQKLVPFGTGDDLSKTEANSFKERCKWLTEQRVLTIRDIMTEEMMEVFAELPGPAMEEEIIQVMAVGLYMIERIREK